jgi:hypothetical protein
MSETPHIEFQIMGKDWFRRAHPKEEKELSQKSDGLDKLYLDPVSGVLMSKKQAKPTVIPDNLPTLKPTNDEPVPLPRQTRRERLRSAARRNVGILVLAGVVVGGVGTYLIDGALEEPKAPVSTNDTTTRQSAIDVLLAQPALLKGFICPAQLEAQADIYNGSDTSSASAYYTAANRELHEVPDINRICPSDAPTDIYMYDNARRDIVLSTGHVMVTRQMVLPNLITDVQPSADPSGDTAGQH